MVNINPYITGKYLKPSDVKENPHIMWEIIEEGSFIMSERFENDQLVLPIKSGDINKLFTVNVSNTKKIQELTKKSDTKQWIGKLLLFDVAILPTQKESIIVKDVK